MATGAPPADGPAPADTFLVRRHVWGRRIGLGVGGALLAILLLAGALLLWINTDPGRRFIVRQINNFEAASGLQVQVGRIEGSVFGELVLHDVALSDPEGVFFRAPRAELDYRPLAYLRNHIDIRSLVIPQARLHRLPQLRAGDPDAPLLPDIDVDVGRLAIGRLLVDPAVTGQRHVLGIDSRIRIADGRAQIGLDLAAIDAPGLPGGDRLRLRLDAVPEANRLALGLALAAPADGFVAGLAGLDRPLALQVNGRGDWARWKGRARAVLGGEGLANLALSARNGTFELQGPVDPGLVLTGPLERLTAPTTLLHLVTTFENRRADLRLRASSRALAVAAEGLVDLGRNRFEDFRVAARLLQPGILAPGLSGEDVRVAAVLDGAFTTPRIAFDLGADSLVFGSTRVEGLQAAGSARLDGDQILLPVSARARRIVGFDAVAGGPITNVRLDGRLGLSGSRLVSDDLRVRADRIDATVALALDFATGRHLAAINGRVNDYLVDGVGLFDVRTDLDLVSAANGFGISGRIAARSKQIDNATVADLLGGPATIAARIDVQPSGVVRFDEVRVAAPLLRVTSGSGVYRPDGSIDLRLAGISESYGALTVAVTGTVAAPRVVLQAANPGFGIGLRDVSAEVRAVAGGWAVTATGESAYGPFTADVQILSGRGPMTILVERLTFAGLDFEGRLVQTAAGPFAGTLTLAGQGLEGVVRLSAAGRYQQIDLAATANDARIPGDVPILLKRGIAEARIILTPTPSISGDVQMAGLASGDLFIERARARIAYQGGRGRAQLLADGRRGMPFRLAVNSELAPDLVRAAAAGEVNGVDFRFARPAEIRREADGWHLLPVAVALDQGRIRLAGRYGDDLIIQSRIEDLDLALANVFAPGLGLGGRVSGSLDFAQPAGGSFPRSEFRLNIADFTRTGIGTRSVPVDIATAGSLLPEGGRFAAVIRRGETIVGRLQARLQPLPPGAGSWSTRLLAAPLSGGIRFNGPADILTSFANLPAHHLSGGIVVAADFRGRVQDPDFVGLVRANNLTYRNLDYGTRITNLALEGRFDQSRLEIVRMNGQVGDGTVSGRGTIGLASAADFPIDLRLVLDNARLARSDDLSATATGEIAIVNNEAGASISGELAVGEARYQIVRQAAEQVRELSGVRRRGDPLPPPGETVEDSAVPSLWNLDLRLRADNRLFVTGMGLESEWSSDLRVEGTSTTPRLTGNLELIRGQLSLAGRRFDVRRGQITFTGGRPINPLLELEAVAEIEGTDVSILVSGSSTEPQIAFTSSPGLPQDEIVSLILFGSSLSEISAIQAVQLAASLNTLRGTGGGLNPLGQLRSATGFSHIRVLGADETTGRGTAVSAGMYLSDDIYIEIVTDARGYTATQIEIALSRTLSLLSQFGGTTGTNATLRYSKDY